MRHKRNTAAMAQAEAEAYELLMTRGVLAATNALIGVCEDPKATAQAKATAGRTIIEATGMLKKEHGKLDKTPAEMTPEELQENLARINRMLAAEDDQGDDLFG